MQTFDELVAELKLTREQSVKIQQYLNELVIELIEGVKEDIIKNAEDTISNLQS